MLIYPITIHEENRFCFMLIQSIEKSFNHLIFFRSVVKSEKNDFFRGFFRNGLKPINLVHPVQFL